MQKELVLSIFLIFWSFNTLRAQGAQSAEARFAALEERIQALEAEVQSLRAVLPSGAPGAPAQAVPATVPAPSPSAELTQAPTGPLPVYGGASAAAKLLNPDISVIGNFVGQAGRNPNDPFPALSLRESEFGFQAIIDPYARADFFVSIGEEGAEVEEGYITFPALPGGFLLKAGQLRSNFGKLNAQHNHVLPWVDRPLLTFNLLGGEPDESDAGIKDAGFSLSRILPAPAGLFLEATGELYRGSSGSLFESSRRSDLSTINHLRAYKDLSESANLEIGGSYARGHNDVGTDFITQLYGVDATLRWKPLRRAIYHSFVARAESVWSRREEEAATLRGRGTAILRARGLFASADYQLARRWFTGARFDWSERARDPGAHDSGESLVLTYWPSEFSQIRGQLRRTKYAEGTTANQLLFQFQYNLGAHGAHPF